MKDASVEELKLLNQNINKLVTTLRVQAFLFLVIVSLLGFSTWKALSNTFALLERITR